MIDIKSYEILACKNIRFLTNRKRIKLGEFENLIGYRKGYISRIEKGGNRRLSVKALIETSEILEVKIDDLLNRDFEEEHRKEEKNERLRIMRMVLEENGYKVTKEGA